MMRIAATVLLLAVLCAGAARGDGKPEPSLPARAASHHAITLGERRIEYDAIAEALPLSNRKGEPTASIFTVSYLLSSAAAGSRPVSFVFNGGPGAASVFLHLGGLGPRVLDTPANGDAPAPPVRLIDNQSTWLPFTDLVFVDPVGTGYSRGEGGGNDPDAAFLDVDSDLASLESVVRLWLTRHQRWGSPVYLVGESYGGYRAAAMAERLPREADVTPSGLVLISPALDFSILHPSTRDLLAAGFYLPSYAATAAALGLARPDGGLSAVERFALSDYLVGLAAMPSQPLGGDPLIARVAAITGLPERVVARNRARIPNRVFADEILRSRDEVVSVYDGTIARPAPSAHDHGRDPLLQPIAADFGTAFNAYVADSLGYRTDLPYRVLSHEIARRWNWHGEHHEGAPGLALGSLEAALSTRPATRVLIVNGRFDLVTPYLSSRWFAGQLQVPAAIRDQIRVRVYPGGHMVYLRPDARAMLAADAARLYSAPGTAPSQ